MSDWQTKKLLEVCEIKPAKNEARKKLKDDDLVSFVPMENLGILNKHISLLKERKLKDVFGSYTYFADGDVLLAKITPCFENGKLGIARNLKNGIGFGSSEYIVFRPSKNLLSDYLFYFLSGDKFRQEGKKNMSGAVGHKRVAKEFIENIAIPLPPLPEQQRIVKILDDVFEKISKAKENLEKNLRNSKELFESYLQSVFANQDSDWVDKKVGDVIQKTETVDPTKKPNAEFIYIDVSSVNKETKSIENVNLILGKNAPSRAKKLIKTNDIIFATVRPTHARVALISEKYNGQVCSTGYFVLRVKEEINCKLIFYFLLTNGFNKQMEKLQKGASYPAVTDNQVKNQIISFPKSLSEQKAIVTKLDALSEQTKKLEAIYKQKLVNLEELKKSVLKKAFSGEL